MEEPELKSAIDALGGDVNKFIEAHKNATVETNERLTQVEQRLSKSTVSGFGGETKSLGQKIVEHEQIKQFLQAGLSRSGRIGVGSFFEQKTTILTDPNTAPLQQRVPGIAVGRVRLRVRNFLNVVPATSNVVEFAKLVLSSSTNAAQPQGFGTSPFQGEGALKSESAMTFVLASEPICTLAHWIPASKQILDDSASLSSFLNVQMMYWLAQKEEAEILNGAATNGELDGLFHQATAYDTSLNGGSDTKIDTLRHSLTQLELSGYYGTVVVVNPADHAKIDLIKTAVGTGGEYVVGFPGDSNTLWDMSIISSAAVTAGKFIAFDGSQVFLYDRGQAVLEVSREHNDYFVRNLVACLAEERLALVVPDTLAIVAGTFPS
jgi:hypothetical protein